MKHKKYFAALLLATATAGFIMPIYNTNAQSLPLPDPAFNANRILVDVVFSDTKTFGGPDGIQKFLDSKGSVLANTAPEFLAMLKEPDSVTLKQSLDDPNPNLTRKRTAAELIWDATTSAGINPQIMLAILNKEQGLITGRKNSTQSALQIPLDHAVGYGCQGSNCQNMYEGFYFQLFGNFDTNGNRYLGSARSLMRAFNAPGANGPVYNGAVSHVGDTIVLSNTTSGYANVQPTQTVTLETKTAAVMYRYDPTVYNSNYNFWYFMYTWFRYPNGTLIRVAGDSNLYIIQNGTRQIVPNFVAQLRNLDVNAAITVSPNELQSYPADKMFGPADNTIISVNGKLYVFIDNVKHPASSFVLSQRKLNPATAIAVSESDASIFQEGAMLTPSEGSVLRGQNNPAVYLVEGGVLKTFTPLTFTQRNAAKIMQVVPDAELDTYPKQGVVAPLNGTIFKSTVDPTVYVLENGMKRGLTAELFRNRGYAYKDIAVMIPEEVALFPTGPIATPKEGSYFQIPETKQIYLFKDGTKHKISAFVAKQRGMTPDYSFENSVAANWADGTLIPPRDNTVIKGDASAAVYLVVNGQLRPLTYDAFVKRKIAASSIVVLTQAEVDGYAKGDVLTQ